jgi:hypothetical protein
MMGKTISHYRILEKLGEGGMGVVYRVADLDRKRRFIQEARAASSLNHPNIITIYDVGSEGGIDFVVMEHVAGRVWCWSVRHQCVHVRDVEWECKLSSKRSGRRESTFLSQP